MTTSSRTASRTARSVAADGTGREHRFAGGAGVLAGVVLIAAFLVLPADDAGTSADAISARYADGSVGYLRAASLETLSLLLTALLLAGMCSWLGSWSNPRPRLAPAAVGLGGAVLVTCQLAGYAVIATLATGTAEAGGPVVTALYDLSAALFVAGNVGLALVTASVAAVTVSTRAHRALGTLSAVTAVAALAGASSFASEGFLSLHGDLGFLVIVLQLLWTVAAGTALVRRPH